MKNIKNAKTQFKKSTMIFILFLIGGLILFCHHFFTPTEIASADNITLPLSPFTAREQKDLIRAQEQEDQLDVTGPLVARMSMTDAQARVLNLNRPSKQKRNT